MSETYPLFAEFIRPELSSLRTELSALTPFSKQDHLYPVDFARAAFARAPTGLALIHELYGRYMRLNVESARPEELFFQDFVGMIVESVRASATQISRDGGGADQAA